MIKVILIFVILAGSLPLPPPPQVKVAATAEPRRIEVVARRFSFDPNTITLKQGEPVTLVLKSIDVPHGIRFRELNVEVKAPKGGTGEVQFTPGKVGDFVGHCSVFCGAGHGSMALTLHVIG